MTEPITDPEVKDPRYDIHYTNGNLAGNFKLKIKQHLFKWIISIIATSGIGSGVHLYYKYQALQEQLATQQQQVYDGIKRETGCYKDLQRADDILSQRFIAPTQQPFQPPYADNTPSNVSQTSQKTKKD